MGPDPATKIRGRGRDRSCCAAIRTSSRCTADLLDPHVHWTTTGDKCRESARPPSNTPSLESCSRNSSRRDPRLAPFYAVSQHGKAPDALNKIDGLRAYKSGQPRVSRRRHGAGKPCHQPTSTPVAHQTRLPLEIAFPIAEPISSPASCTGLRPATPRPLADDHSPRIRCAIT